MGRSAPFNLLDIAARERTARRRVDPYIAEPVSAGQRHGRPGGSSRPTTALYQNTLRFINPDSPDINIYPTGRVDYQASPSLAVRGVVNLHYRDLPRNPPFPGMEQINGGFKSTYYIVSARRRLDGPYQPVQLGNRWYSEQFRGVQSGQPREPGRALHRPPLDCR